MLAPTGNQVFIGSGNGTQTVFYLGATSTVPNTANTQVFYANGAEINADTYTSLFLWNEDLTHSTAVAGGAADAKTANDASAATQTGRLTNGGAAIPDDALTYIVTWWIAKTGDVIPAIVAKFTGGTAVQWNLAVETATGKVNPLTSSYNAAQYLVEDDGTYWKISLQMINNNTGAKVFNYTIYPAWALVWSGLYVTAEGSAVGTVGIDKVQVSLMKDQGSTLWYVEGDSISATVQSPPYGYRLGLKPTTNIVIKATPSNTLAQMKTRYDTYKTDAFTIFSLMGGVNSISAGVTAASMQADWTYMTADAAAKGCRVVVFTVSPWKDSTGWDTTKQAATEAFNTWIRAQAAALGYTLIDAYALLEDPANPGQLLPEWDKGDKIHPGPGGHQVLSQAILAVVDLPKPYYPYAGVVTTTAVSLTGYTYTNDTVVFGTAPAAGATVSRKLFTQTGKLL